MASSFNEHIHQVDSAADMHYLNGAELKALTQKRNDEAHHSLNDAQASKVGDFNNYYAPAAEHVDFTNADAHLFIELDPDVQMARAQRRRGQFKVVVAGERQSGKSSMLNRLRFDDYSDQTQHLQGPEGSRTPAHAVHRAVSLQPIKDHEMPEKPPTLVMWDIGGPITANNTIRHTLKGSMAVVICYDITKRDGLDKVDEYVAHAHAVEEPGVPHPLIILVGTKLDLAEDLREISTEAGELKAEAIRAHAFFEVSCKEALNTGALFEKVASLVWQRFVAMEKVRHLHPAPPALPSTGSASFGSEAAAARPVGKTVGADWVDDTDWYLRDRKDRKYNQHVAPPKETAGHSTDPATSYEQFENNYHFSREFKDAHGAELIPAQVPAISSAEDSEYYMFQSKNSRIMSPEARSVTYTGPSNIGASVKHTHPVFKDYHYPEKHTTDGEHFPKRPVVQLNTDHLDEAAWYQEKSKNAAHLWGRHTKRGKPILVPVYHVPNVANIKQGEAAGGFTALYEVSTLYCTINGVKEVVNAKMPEWQIDHMKITVQNKIPGAPPTVLGEEALNEIGSAVEISELKTAIAEGQSVPEGARHIALINGPNMFTSRGQFNEDDKLLYMTTLSIQECAPLTEALARQARSYNDFVESAFDIMDAQDGHEWGKVNTDDLVRFFANTRAADRPDGPMREKEKFSLQEVIAIQREIAEDWVSIAPVPFDRAQFIAYCEKYHQVDSNSVGDATIGA